jgi:beta-lactamase regulating signal transducer with metallopeptidase domain
MRVDQELACDATVIEARPALRRSYGEALLKTQLSACVPPVGCTWPSRAPHPLKERIAMLKSPPPTRRRRLVGAALLAGLALGGGYAAWAAQPGHVITNPDWVQRRRGRTWRGSTRPRP